MTGAYTAAAAAALALVLALELAVMRTGVLRRARYWATIAITLAFQVPVDGWLTKLSAPIVLYRPGAILGVRWPWDIPVEDFGFTFAMITFTLMLWERAQRRAAVDGGGRPARASGSRR